MLGIRIAYHRNQMDMIVFYDNDSRGIKSGSPLEILYEALYTRLIVMN
jgi:hypothetical protein